ncbi:MAG: HU family DNA-binding protein [Rickettsiaceae bacterium]|nr:HU family DNA-binding protein [Rickettsiaceae bacterium]
MMNKINKEKIAIALENEIGFPLSVCKDIVTKTFDSAMDILLKEKALKIKNFGNFALKSKSARPGRNPKTMEPLEVSAREIIAFSPSRNLKKELN